MASVPEGAALPGVSRHVLASNRRDGRGTGQRVDRRTVDWRTSGVKNCEPVANQARAGVCSTATDEVRLGRESMRDPVSGRSRGADASVPEPGAVVMSGAGAVLLGLFARLRRWSIGGARPFQAILADGESVFDRTAGIETRPPSLCREIVASRRNAFSDSPQQAV